MAALFPFEVHTPYRLFFNDSVETIVLTLIDGEIAIYANHVHFSAPVVPCILRIKDKEGSYRNAFAAGGILEVKDRKAVLISEAAEWAEEIDYERAKMAKGKAEQNLTEGMMKFEKKAATNALLRANMRIRAFEEVRGRNISAD